MFQADTCLSLGVLGHEKFQCRQRHVPLEEEEALGGDGDAGRLGQLALFVMPQESPFWDSCGGQRGWEVNIGGHTLRTEWPLPDSVSRATLVKWRVKDTVRMGQVGRRGCHQRLVLSGY